MDKIFIVVERNHRFNIDIIKASFKDYNRAARYAGQFDDDEFSTYTVVACDHYE